MILGLDFEVASEDYKFYKTCKRRKGRSSRKLNEKTRNSRGLIYPVKGRNDPHVGPDVLMVMIHSDLQNLVRTTRAKEVPFSEMKLYHLYQAKGRKGVPVTLSGPFFGAPHAVIAMEKLIVLGAKRIWVLGWCGSLQHNLRIGNILIPTSAISEEGTSAHYPISNRAIESDAELNLMLEMALQQRGLPFSKGPVWTTDAVYRETPDKAKAFQDQGVLAVEMEISALMTLAIYRSVAMAGLLVISDELFDLKWQRGFRNPLLKTASRDAAEVLLSLAGYETPT